MPFKSKKQRAWMFANKPALAKKWAKKYGGKVKPKKKAARRAPKRKRSRPLTYTP